VSLIDETRLGVSDAPHDLDIEHALLACLLEDNRRVALVADTLKADHFFDPVNARVYEAIRSFADRGEVADYRTLAPFVADLFEGDRRRATAHLIDLTDGVVGGKAADYARVVVDMATRRHLIAIADDLKAQARHHSLHLSAFDMVEATEAALMKLSEAAPTVKALVAVRTAVEDAIQAADDAARSGNSFSGITTGFRDLDWRTGGLQPGDLIAVGARPSMGKSDLGWNIAINAGRARAAGQHGGASVLVFSMEMEARQLGARLLARETGVAADRQRRGDVSDEDFARFAQAVPDLPVWIDSTARVTPAHILRRCRRLQQRRELGLVVVDHLAIMGAPDGFRSQGETAVITEITREMKGIATTLGVPILLLAQLSRANTLREDKRPQLSDLRSSGSIEQDADSVWFVHREQYYLERSEPVRRADESVEKFEARHLDWQQRSDAARNVAEVIVAKQRMGGVGTVQLHYDGAHSRFADLHQNGWDD
jgi:replicative DNA helicase